MNYTDTNLTCCELECPVNDTNITAEIDFPTILPEAYAAILPITTVLLILLSFGGAVANILVVAMIVRTKKLRRPANFYILSASVNDTIGCLIAVNGLNVFYHFGYRVFPYALCMLWVLCDYTTSMVSLLHMTLLAWDRHEAIVNPLQYASPSKKLRIGVRIAMIYSVSYVFVLSFVIIVLQNSPYGCYLGASNNFFWMYTMLALVTPFVSMFTFYIRCIIALHRQFTKVQPNLAGNLPAQQPQQQQQQQQPKMPSRQMMSLLSSIFTGMRRLVSEHAIESSQGTQTSNNTAPGAATEETSGVGQALSLEKNISSEQQKQPHHTASAPTAKRQQEHFRYIRTLAYILCSFLVLSGPITICSLYTLSAKNSWQVSCTGKYLGDLIVYTAPYFHNGLNPILVIMSQREFRQAVAALFCRDGKKK